MRTPGGDFSESSDLGTPPKSSHCFQEAISHDRSQSPISVRIEEVFTFSPSWALNWNDSLGWAIPNFNSVFAPGLVVIGGWFAGTPDVEPTGEIVTNCKVTGIPLSRQHDFYEDSPPGFRPIASDYGAFFNMPGGSATVDYFNQFRSGTYNFNVTAGDPQGSAPSDDNAGMSMHIYLVSTRPPVIPIEIATYTPGGGLVFPRGSPTSFNSTSLLGNNGNFTIRITFNNMGLGIIDRGDYSPPSSPIQADYSLPDWRTTDDGPPTDAQHGGGIYGNGCRITGTRTGP